MQMTIDLSPSEGTSSGKPVIGPWDGRRRELREFLAGVDAKFLPSLSCMDGDIGGVIDELFEKSAEVSVARDAGGICGLLGYWRFPGNDIYAHILAVRRDIEGTVLPLRLVRGAVRKESKDSPACVHARTWSTNRRMIRLLQHLGFVRYRFILKDFGGARTSYWYRCVWSTLVARRHWVLPQRVFPLCA